jgi:hypothetical protein
MFILVVIYHYIHVNYVNAVPRTSAQSLNGVVPKRN